MSISQAVCTISLPVTCNIKNENSLILDDYAHDQWLEIEHDPCRQPFHLMQFNSLSLNRGENAGVNSSLISSRYNLLRERWNKQVLTIE